MENKMSHAIGTLMGFFQSKCLSAALEFKVFDYLNETPKSLNDLGAETGLPVSSLKRLLIALSAMGFVKKSDSGYTIDKQQEFFLKSDQGQWLGWMASHVDAFLYPLWGNAADAIRSNSDQRAEVFGDKRSWFDILYQNPSDVIDFQKFLGILAQPFVDGIVNEFTFDKHKKFLDIGSGIGTLPIAVADKFPELEVSICELPQAAAFLRDQLGEKGVTDRVGLVEGNVIEGDLPVEEYDLIHVGWMLHDYSEELQFNILQNVYNSLPAGGTFIASETPLNDDEQGPEFTSLLSINMLVSTDGGIESTVSEYIERFEKVGFTNVRVMDISGPRTLFVGEKPKSEGA